MSVNDVVLFVAMNRDLYELVRRERYQKLFQDELENDIEAARRFISFEDDETSHSDSDDDKADEN